MLSFWESSHFITYQYIIVGSGIVGLSTAISLAEKYPHAAIAVLERGIFPTGASTRNAGFACFGSLTELLADSQTVTHQEMLALVQERWQGLAKLRQRLGDDAMQYEGLGGYELITAKELPALEKLDEVNQWLFPIFKQNVFERKDELITTFGFNPAIVKALVYNRFEGQIDTGKMMKALLALAQSKGVTIFTGAEVTAWQDNITNIEVSIKDQARQENIIFKAQKLIFCTNAFTPKLIPKINLNAGRGQVFVTKEIAQMPFKGAFHYDEGYFYFRNIGKRILLGGGRNLDFEGETTTELQTTTYIIDSLKELLHQVIAPQIEFEIDQAWAGIMAFGEVKIPIIEFHSPNVIIGVRCGGMGVAIGTNMGEKLASLVLQ
jgi:glycine/D-amino acid oxidase-like deaminating enzyme